MLKVNQHTSHHFPEVVMGCSKQSVVSVWGSQPPTPNQRKVTSSLSRGSIYSLSLTHITGYCFLLPLQTVKTISFLCNLITGCVIVQYVKSPSSHKHLPCRLQQWPNFNLYRWTLFTVLWLLKCLQKPCLLQLVFSLRILYLQINTLKHLRNLHRESIDSFMKAKEAFWNIKI